jgi:protein gp37
MEDICPEFGDHLDGYAWVIVGGQSGNRTLHFRPLDHQWVRNIRDLCRRRAIAMFFKQSSGFTTETGVKLDGELVREYPQGHAAPSGEVG